MAPVETAEGASVLPAMPSPTSDGGGFMTLSSVGPAITSTGYPPWGNNGGNGGSRGYEGPNREASTQMYLFTFLATVALLSIVGACLLWRAIVVRRRFHRQVVEAIMRGEPIPNFRSPFITRLPTPPKKEIVLGPMPRMWQSEMRRDDLDKHEEEKGEWAREEDGWKHLNPVSLHAVRSEAPEPPAPIVIPELPSIASELRDAVRDMWPRRRRSPPRVPAPPESPVEMEPPVVADAPEPGTSLRVGVLIAMPCEGEGAARWTPMDPVEAEVPEVMFGVMECLVEGEAARAYGGGEDKGKGAGTSSVGS